MSLRSLVVAAAVSVGLGATAYAGNESPTPSSPSTCSCPGHAHGQMGMGGGGNTGGSAGMGADTSAGGCPGMGAQTGAPKPGMMGMHGMCGQSQVQMGQMANVTVQDTPQGAIVRFDAKDPNQVMNIRGMAQQMSTCMSNRAPQPKGTATTPQG